ncbi:MAG TPA: glycine/sarcosine/betaine reductase component B subunit, partial [Acidimicrobiales bacterium]|nr:glycine/sarcosine/betaine reductase component B subunit [Acidimicrobiales bacterium]
ADWADVDDALRRGSLALAARLADTALDAPADGEETVPAPDAVEGLPRIAAITNLQTQGVFKDVFVRGTSFNGQAPTFIDPGEIDDGAVVSGQFGHPSLRNPTWVHQNHPVANALRARHGVDLAFGGVVLSPEPVSAADKARISTAAAELCAQAGFDAVILTKEGGGNADADMALKMDALEDMGIATVGLFAEMAGPDGTGPPIVVAPERATAMVSTGNYDTRLSLPEMERALGGEQLALLGVPATSAMELPTAVILASLSPLGWGRLTCSPSATGMVSG